MESLGTIPNTIPMQKRGAVDSACPRVPLRHIAEKIHCAAARTSTIEHDEAARFSHLLNSKLRFAIKNKLPEDENNIRGLIEMLNNMHPEVARVPPKPNNKRKKEHNFVDRSCDWVWRFLREKPLNEIKISDRRLMITQLGRRIERINPELESLRKRVKASPRYRVDIDILEAMVRRHQKAIERLETFEEIGRDIADPRRKGFENEKPLVEHAAGNTPARAGKRPAKRAANGPEPVDLREALLDATNGEWWNSSDYKCSGLRR